ncbi:glycosyltransferase [Sediminicola luteus]|uniref:Glycosyl transferase family 2 n=1 Tax=Sediminicola luteus TaxID=319238 RepID=A0A2A4G5Z0_9FLAO|nr:glycosyltransferase [Sediminicola luteus]PCE63841.1 glycosyl transferase family 2 [Sediminicola luteus]
MAHPKVSILIPFKNTEAYLPQCLDSIIGQTYQNWEVLAVNDHSTDQSRALVQGYAQKDDRIKIFDNNGTGIIEGLRTAYSQAQGNMVSRMDSDDIMKPEKLAYMTQALVQSGPGHVSVGQVKYFSDRGISNGYARYETWLNQLTETGSNYQEIYKECSIPSPAWMTFTEDLDRVGAFEPNLYPEDYDLTFRFYKHGLQCIPCSQVLHLWRDYDTRTSRTSEHYAQNYFLDIKLRYFLELEYDKTRPLVIWGAGNKGKQIARDLQQQNIPFYWICDNPNKIGKDIYGEPMRPFTFLQNLAHAQSIITVANEDAQKEIRAYMAQRNMHAMTDYFFFC